MLISVDGEHADSMTLPQLLEQEQLLQAVASKGKALVDLPLPPVAEPNEIAVHLSVDRKAANPPCDSCPADPLDELLPAAEVEEGEVKPVAELPSYLRPTAAHQARASRASPLPTIAQVRPSLAAQCMGGQGQVQAKRTPVCTEEIQCIHAQAGVPLHG